MKKVKLFMLIAGLCIFARGNGQNEKFKAIFIYNFTNYIEWPEGSGSVFVITVIGESPIIKELDEIARRKKIGGASIEIRKVSSVSEIGNTNAVYIPSGKKKMMGEIASTLNGKPVLIISDNAQDVFGINFIDAGGKQSFEISKRQMAEHKLKVNATLYSLGKVVN